MPAGPSRSSPSVVIRDAGDRGGRATAAGIRPSRADAFGPAWVKQKKMLSWSDRCSIDRRHRGEVIEMVREFNVVIEQDSG